MTGGAGFIGSHLVDRLLAHGLKVRVLDDLSSGKRENLALQNPDLEFIEGSIEDVALVKTACEDIGAVVHLAALVSVPVSIEQPDRSAAINVSGFLNLLNQLRSQNFKGRFLYASSSAVYGEGLERAVTEQDAPGHLLSPYAVDKYTNELYAGLYAELYGLSTLGFRFFNVYGPRQDPGSDYSGVISIFMDRAFEGNAICVHGDGEQVRDFVYVEDVAKVLHAGLESRQSGVLNIGTGAATSIKQLALLVQQIQQSSGAIEHAPARAGDIRYSCADTGNLEQALKLMPKVTLQEGLGLLKHWLESG